MIKQRRTREVARTTEHYVPGTGVYVSVMPTLETQVRLARWSELLGLDNEEQLKKLHCTVVWSKNASDVAHPGDPRKTYLAKLLKLEYWDGHDNDGYLVAILNSSDLHTLNKVWASRGVAHSFADYTPHVTLQSKLEFTPELKAKVEVFNSKFKGSLLAFDRETIKSAKS